jgi:hypothetical protein
MVIARVFSGMNYGIAVFIAGELKLWLPEASKIS